jgi:hypothetical protein
MAKFVNDDGAFEAGFEQNLPEPVRDYAKGFKTLADALNSGLESRQGFRERVKIPTEAEARKKFLAEHFGPDLAAQETERKKVAEDSVAAAQKKAEEDAAKVRTEKLEKAAAAAKTLLGGSEGKDYEKNLELCRRVVRGEHCPTWIVEGIARAAGVEVAKLTDDQIKAAIASDPAVADTLRRFATLTQDGRMEHGDGHAGGTADEQTPIQPSCPHLYANLPPDHPIRKWFKNRNIEVREL